MAATPGCELASGVLAEPVATWSSLAFVVAGVLAARRSPTFGGLVAAVGVGSVVQHGPDPAWSDLAHDLPLAGTLAFLAADAGAHRAQRPRRWWWWVAPTAALAPLVVAAPRPADLVQVGFAVVAVAGWLAVAAGDPARRPRIAVALGLLAVGGVVGRLGGAGGPLCDPTSLWQGHAVWHVTAATALALLAPSVTRGHASPTHGGARGATVPRAPGDVSGRTRP